MSKLDQINESLKTTGHLKKFPNLNLKKIQVLTRKFGASIAGMIMPAIGVIIAWGLITAMFASPTSALYNKEMSAIIGIGITYTIPSLIGWFAGYQIYKVRGGLMGVLIALGCIAGSQQGFFKFILYGDANYQTLNPQGVLESPPNPVMFLGAMIGGPLSAWVFKKLEALWKDKIPQGFEMLINNFSLGIIGCIFCLISFWAISAVVAGILRLFFIIIRALNESQLIILTPIFWEPARLMFLNNAIDYGIFTTLAIAQTNELGHGVGSYYYYFIDNPGPGLGLLLAFFTFSGNKRYKQQTISAMPIEFIGGIHEVYFPFALLKPISIPFLILADMFNIWIYQSFSVGAIANVSPGSVIAGYAVNSHNPNSLIGLSIAEFGSAILVWLIFGLFLIFSRIRNGEKIIWNPKFILINSRYQKYLKSDLIKLYKKYHFNDLIYQTIVTKKSKQHLVETITYEDGSIDKTILPIKHNKITNIEYLDIAKKNKKKTKRILIRNHQNNFHGLVVFKNKVLAFFDGQKIKNNQSINKINPLSENKKIINISYEVSEINKRTATIYYQVKQKNKMKKIHLPFDFHEINLEELKLMIENEAATQANSLSDSQEFKDIKSIVFACEAGMGSSAMGAGILRKLLKENNLSDISVVNVAIKDLSDEYDLVISQKSFAEQVKSKTSKNYFPVEQFLDKSQYEKLVTKIKNSQS